MSDTYLFTSESVSEGHPDKVADQISDAILDVCLAIDPDSKVACETLVTTNRVIVSGEITVKKKNGNPYTIKELKETINFKQVIKDVIIKIGYNQSDYKFYADKIDIDLYLESQSTDIAQGVENNQGLYKEQGAGDQGIMFGYAINETKDYMPLALDISHKILIELANIRKTGKEMPYLRPDSKSQVTIEYDACNHPKRIDTIVISTQHDEFILPKNDTVEEKKLCEKNMRTQIETDIKTILMPRVIEKLSEENKKLFQNEKYYINPTGKFVIGGPHGDTGLTGRKIIVDTYGGKGAHGGGAFSGKDSSKVDRSAAYATRHIAKNLVAARIANEVLVQVSYAIGVAKPMNLYVNTYSSANINLSDSEISKKLESIFDLRPATIINRFKLKSPIYFKTASYGHMGRESKKETFILTQNQSWNKKILKKEIEIFPWEKLDYVDKIKKVFSIN